jgi:hypothetical protein
LSGIEDEDIERVALHCICDLFALVEMGREISELVRGETDGDISNGIEWIAAGAIQIDFCSGVVGPILGSG